MTTFVPASPKSCEDCDFDRVIRKVDELIHSSKEILSILAPKKIEEVLNAKTFEELIILVYPLFFDLYRNPSLSILYKQKLYDFFIRITNRINMFFSSNEVGDEANCCEFLFNLQKMDTSRKMSIDHMLDPLCFNTQAALIKKEKLKNLMSSANSYQTQAVYMLLAERINGWNFEVNIDTLPLSVVNEMLDIFDNTSFVC
ncbi:hypothetical protein EIN_497580 [Entamoeba invadens IP1]|uniref:Uncharacterized protein n=1 Tax=Entamoeba invadens IP1 TaxID=370355 RepID=A0A0A1UH35_ENTIV|nr:hypothetical protein EIN_497580 [Entamoeba invadens IP1]ELP94598.1 hypothetical protein EIN_497580 [Entamoeba invadens IP1]|eukprot:XP_004261369.1 hypothetical protein EIN_497580 [Entamoeba invadens IP1]